MNRRNLIPNLTMLKRIKLKGCSIPSILKNVYLIVALIFICLQFRATFIVFFEKYTLKSYPTIQIKPQPHPSPKPYTTNKTLLTLFTTWDSNMENGFVYNNTLHMWKHLESYVIKLLLFSDDIDLTSYAQTLGWEVAPILNTACNDTPAPVLKTMFEYAKNTSDSYFYGYANADILFGQNLIDTLIEILHSKIYYQKQILVTGKRIDVALDQPTVKNRHIRTQEQLESIAKQGLVSYGYAEDYFITNVLFSWKMFPDLVVGRSCIDNWLVYSSRKQGAHVIDASSTIVAVHQKTHKRKRRKSNCNGKILEEKYKRRASVGIRRGNVECAQYETRYTYTGKIFIIRRGLFTTIC